MPIVKQIPCTAVTIGLRHRLFSANASMFPGLISVFSALGPKEFRHIQPGREIRAFGTEYPDPVIVRSVEKRHRIPRLRHHLRTEGVLLRHVVDDDLENMPVHLGADLTDFGYSSRSFAISELLLKRFPSDLNRWGFPKGYR